MFKFDVSPDESRLLNRKRSLPKPGRVHGGGGKLRGRKTDKYIDVRPSVNKNNPHIRGTGNIVAGKFVDSHDADDKIDGRGMYASSIHSIGRPVAFIPSGRNRPLRCR